MKTQIRTHREVLYLILKDIITSELTEAVKKEYCLDFIRDFEKSIKQTQDSVPVARKPHELQDGKFDSSSCDTKQ